MFSVHVSRVIPRAAHVTAASRGRFPAPFPVPVPFRASQHLRLQPPPRSLRPVAGEVADHVQAGAGAVPAPVPLSRISISLTPKATAPATITGPVVTPYRATSSILFPSRHFTSTSTTTLTPTSNLHITRIPMQGRAFSSEGVEPTRDFNTMKRAKNTYEEWKPRIKTYAIIATIAGCFYIIYSVAKWTIDFFASINFAEVGEVAFVAGLLSGFAIVLTGWLGTRFLVLRPEPIYKAILRRILNENAVKQELGTELKVGSFRAYSFSDGGVRWQAEKGVQYSGWDRYWKPRKLQLFFQVSGPRGHGMVSAEVEKNLRGQQKYNVLAVDILDTGKHVVLEGDPTRALYQGVIRLR